MTLKSSMACLAFLAISGTVYAQTPGSTDIQGNCNAVGNGNIVCSPMRFGFSEELGRQLLAGMPDKKKSVQLQTVGSNTDQQIGSQVEQYLISHGYVVQRMAIGMLAPPPDHPFTLQNGGNQYVVTVAPSAH